MNLYLPRDKVFIPELDVHAIVVGVYISSTGTEYKVRYFKEQVPYETYFFDFELANNKDNSFA